MAGLPPVQVATLVSNVTRTICGGLAFKIARETEATSKPWRLALLGIPALTKGLLVGISSDEPGCRAIAAGMLKTGPRELDNGLVEDTLRELVNMVAGQVKRAMAIDDALGLPKIVSFAEVESKLTNEGSQRVTMASGPVSLTVWISKLV